MSLVPCTNIVGDQIIHTGEPPVRIIQNAIYVPRDITLGIDTDLEWGIYDSEGYLVEHASYRRGPGPSIIGQSKRTALAYAALPTLSIPNCYYGGLAYHHYGHFLLATASRFRGIDESDATILHHLVDRGIEEWRRLPFVRSFLASAGLSRTLTVAFKEPVRVERLIVPAPGFEEQHCAYTSFRESCLSIAGTVINSGDGIAYLSKERLTSGIQRVINEQEVTSRLRDFGGSVFFPETMSLADQIRCFQDHRVIMGTAGSAIHTALFAPETTRLVTVSPTPAISSNFLLIEKISGIHSRNLHLAGGLSDLGPIDGFFSNTRWEDPETIARELLREAEALV